MKKYWKFVPVIAGLVYLLLFVPRFAHAAGDVEINSTNFPDSVFRQYVKDNFDINKDNKLNSNEIQSIGWISANDEKIRSLKGIEHLTNLRHLECSGNQLTALDVSKNTGLTWLNCDNNQLTALDISKNTALTYVFCNGNQLTELDVSKNTALIQLECDNNLLTALDVSRNTELISLYCYHNQLTTLDVSKNTALRDLTCGANQLTRLDVSRNTALRDLFCENNQLTVLDVSGNAALDCLDCYGNRLKKLDISHCPILLNTYLTGVKYDRANGIIGIMESYEHENEGEIEYALTRFYYDGTTAVITVDENPFSDVKHSDSYYEAVMWAVKNGIASGTSATTFSPNVSCTRYQFAAMLYKLNGKPAVGNVTLPFTDVKTSDSYYNAVAWAYTNGIISGTSKTTFSPKSEVTRYQVVQVLYKSVGKPAISTTTNPFKDVKKTDSYYKAVLWAVEKGITKGTSSTTFSPKETCKRYQMVVFLKKFNDQYHIK